MKYVIKTSLLALALAATACDDGSTSDPATVSRDALQPPTGLTTVTWDKKIELRFKGANAEDDFKGYHVFAVKKKVSELGTAAYPKNLTVDLKTGSIPRCVDNTAIFELFGFKASEADCEGDAEPATTGTGSTLMADAGDTEDEEKITNIVKCAENTTDTTISLTATSPNLGDMICTVSALHDGTALENGETYSFFVAAVSGDDKSTISWTSNFVEDTPAASLFQTDAFTIAGTGGSGYVIPAAKITGLASFTATDVVSTACITNDFCTVNRQNANKTVDGIYIGRRGAEDPTYKARTFISTPANSAIKLVPRGAQVLDPVDNAFSFSIPGDMAADTDYAAGALFPIYGYQVFDMEVTVGSATHYGKIVFGQPTLADGADPESSISVPMAVIMQPDAGNRNYLVSPDLQF